jgi:hypothetical protein
MSKAQTPWFEQLVVGRECGECTVCCFLPHIATPEFTKPAKVLCQHCTGTGCGIYERRPNVCRTWHCAWRRLERMADNLRPDICGVVFSLEVLNPAPSPFERAAIVGRVVDEAASLSPDAQAAFDTFISDEALPVWISRSFEKKLLWPDEKLASAILWPNTTPWIHLLPKAQAFRNRYRMSA